MILFPPVRFDANEWFIIIASLLAFACIWKLPKRFPQSMSLLWFLVSLILAKLFDTILVVPPLEAYYVNDIKERAEWFDVLLYAVYGPFGYLFLYAYDRFHPKAFGTVAFIALTSLLSLLFEWVAVLVGVFHYTGWQLYYSLPVYIAVQCSSVLLFDRLKQVYVRTKC